MSKPQWGSGNRDKDADVRQRKPSGTAAVQVGRAEELLDCQIVLYASHASAFDFACHFCFIVDECMFGLGQQGLFPEARVPHRTQMRDLMTDVRNRSLLVAQGKQPASMYAPLASGFVGTMDQELAFEYESHFFGVPPKCRVVRVKPTDEPQFPFFQHHHLVALALSEKLVESIVTESSRDPFVALRVAALTDFLQAAYQQEGAMWLKPELSPLATVWPEGCPQRAIKAASGVTEEKLEKYQEALTSN